MKHKVAELEGELLDRAVTKVAPGLISWGGERVPPWSTNWSLGGILIAQQRIVLVPSDFPKGDVVWSASVGARPHYIDDELPFHRETGSRGPTPLIAAMRAYVASKFGEEIDLEL